MAEFENLPAGQHPGDIADQEQQQVSAGPNPPAESKLGPPAPPETKIELDDGTMITLADINEFHLERAMRAYRRSGETDQPSRHLSGVCEYRRRHYVRLANVNVILAVWRGR